MGRCPDCGQWNSLVEDTVGTKSRRPPMLSATATASCAMPIDAVEPTQTTRILTDLKEFDRVLGGGIVPGSLVLIGGDPGIGKSTLMLQVLCELAARGHKSLYVSGEESVQQIKMRSERLQARSRDMWVVSETSLAAISALADELSPVAMVVDSVQTLYSPELTSAPGTVSQVREAAMQLMFLSKQTGVAVFVVGHVTKEGAIAGPRLLEHMVDTVLYFEGGQNNAYRVLRAVKNRFGSTNEIGVFEMQDHGLQEVPNPSCVFLPEHPRVSSGSVITASIEGSRPILLEIQGLVSRSGPGTGRRTVLGVDYNRVMLLVAVMEKRLGLELMNDDIFVNVAGGIKADEPAMDLPIVSVIASSFFDRPIVKGTLVLGEIGLTGEVRPVNRIEARIREAEKMGFGRCVLPQDNLKHLNSPHHTLALIGIDTVAQLLDCLF